MVKVKELGGGMVLARRRVGKKWKMYVWRGPYDLGLKRYFVEYLWSDGTWSRSRGRRHGYDDGGGYFKSIEQVELALAKSALLEAAV